MSVGRILMCPGCVCPVGISGPVRVPSQLNCDGMTDASAGEGVPAAHALGDGHDLLGPYCPPLGNQNESELRVEGCGPHGP